MRTHFLGELTTEEVRSLVAERAIVLLPVGSVEPHGPHLPLTTDTQISLEACRRAAVSLSAKGYPTVIAPSIPYGVTDFATGFAGAISTSREVLEPFVRAVVQGLLHAGFAHVCVVNNHLEPAQDQAIRGAVGGLSGTSVACPLTRRWGRTLTDEFKRGECHAGQYETSLMLALGALPGPHQTLPPVPVSLSEGIKHGKHTFVAMGMDHAYSGTPSSATALEGEATYERLREMIETEVLEQLQA